MSDNDLNELILKELVVKDNDGNFKFTHVGCLFVTMLTLALADSVIKLLLDNVKKHDN